MTKINGGYYIKARKIQESDIAIAPPHVREIWDWLIKEANHTTKKLYGRIVERGSLIRTYAEIQEGLHWMVGYRKETYTRWQCEMAMKWLTKHKMITTTKTTRGLLITICKYDYYQDPKNYESHTENHKKATRKPQPPDTINKNEKNVRKEEERYPSDSTEFQLAQYCINRITNNFPSLRKKLNSDIQIYSHTMHQLIEIDKKSPDEIKRVIDWVTNHREERFSWALQFQAPTKLREKKKGYKLTYFERWQGQMEYEKKVDEPPDFLNLKQRSKEREWNT